MNEEVELCVMLFCQQYIIFFNTMNQKINNSECVLQQTKKKKMGGKMRGVNTESKQDGKDM